ncbi:MAG: SGNH/GDSL hydrolase family protein [Arcicella sp.]|nr:SGNH/GDSL hydrolase family protein [Arcicella sp.]
MEKITQFLLLIIIMLSCNSTESKIIISPNPVNNMSENNSKRTFLALGDSYTIGESVDEKDRWSIQLISLMKNEFNITKHEIIARTGWTTAELIDVVEAKKLNEQYDMVSLLIGVNNQYRGQSLDTYRVEFRQLLNISTKLSKNDPKKVIVLSVPDWGKTPFAQGKERDNIATEIDAFNLVAKEECTKMNIIFIDITEITRKNIDSSMFASDGLHYSGEMHRLWANQALQISKNILK